MLGPMPMRTGLDRVINKAQGRHRVKEDSDVTVYFTFTPPEPRVGTHREKAARRRLKYQLDSNASEITFRHRVWHLLMIDVP
jgi:hypothetical protein